MKLIKIHQYLISANYLHINWLAFLPASSLINSIPNMWNSICKLVPGLIKCSNLLSIQHFVKHNNERHFGDNWFEIVTIWRHYHHHWHIVANLMLAFSGPKHETNQFDSSRIRSHCESISNFKILHCECFHGISIALCWGPRVRPQSWVLIRRGNIWI